MARLDPDRLLVEYREGVTATSPIIPRCYTLTHSDITADLFLTIGPTYAYDKVNIMRDEVLGEWINKGYGYICGIYLHIDGPVGMSAIRSYMFRRELPLALEAIRYGDKAFFHANPELDRAMIIVHFESADPLYNKVENWGTFSDYNIETTM